MKKISVRNALYLSIGIIFLMWLRKIIQNIYYSDLVLKLAQSNLFLLSAMVNGIVTVLIVTLLLRLSKENYKDIGFDTQNILRQLRNGLLFGVLIFILDTFLIGTIVDVLLPKTSVEGIDMSKLFNNLYFLPVWIFISVFKGGFSEELWRIFALTRFEKCFGKPGLLFALILGSVVFGFGHLYQGVGGMLSIAILGLLYALVYLRKRLAFEAVFAHATFDIIAITLGYIIYYS
jgi:membrane protease YdiL (CAAX protease family)